MKKHSYRKQLSILLVIALVVTSFPSYVFGYANAEDATQPVLAAEEKPIDSIEAESGIKYDPDYKGEVQIVDELTSKRGEFEKHFVRSDGTAIAVSYPEAVHYQVNGTWEDIDSRLVVKDKEKGLYGPAASDLQVLLPGSATADILVPATKSGDKDSVIKLSSNYLTKVTDGEYSISWNILGNSKDYTSDFLSKATSKTLDKGLVPVSTLAPTPQLDFAALSKDEQKTTLPNLVSTAIYKNIVKNVDLSVTVTPNKLKENLILSSPKGFESISYLINAGNLIGKINEDNSVIFSNDKDEIVFTIPTPLMLDSNTLPEESMDISLALKKTSEGYILTLTPDAKWLNDPARVYPVVLDPTIKTTQSVSNVKDTYIHSGDTAGEHYLSSYIRIGDTDIAICRGYVDFVTRPSIDTDLNDIVGGDFIGYLVSGTSTYHEMKIYQTGTAWTNSTITWANKPTTNTYLSSANGVSSGGYYKYTFNVDSSAKNWYSTGVNNGYVLRYTDETINDYNWFYSSDHPTISTSYYPCLAIEYAPHTLNFTVSPNTSSSAYTKVSTPTLNWSTNDLHCAGIQIAIGSGAYTTISTSKTGSYTVPTGKVVSGANAIKLRVVDASGNTTIQSTVNYYYDNSAPIIGSITAAKSDGTNIPLPAFSTYTNPVIKLNNITDTYSGLKSTGNTYAIRQVGSSDTLNYVALPAPVGANISVTAPITTDGSYNIYFKILDNAGNETNTNITYTLDRVAPALGTITITPATTPITPTTVSNPTITWGTITEPNLASVQYKLDSGSYITMGTTSSGSYTLPTNSITSEGLHTITIKAVDKTGNFVESSPQYYSVDDSLVLDSNTYIGTATLTNYYGKNLIHWNPPAVIPSQVYYKVYRGTTPSFTMDSSTLLAEDLKTSYYVDMNIGGTGTYYYKVKCIKKNIYGQEVVSNIVSSEMTGTQKSATEFSAGIGQNFYMDYFTFGTPSGNGYVEKRYGNLGYGQQDFTLSNMEFDYGLTRTYNSQSANTGMLGKGWSDSYHQEIYKNSDGKYYFRQGDGTTYTFALVSGSTYKCEQTKEYSLTVNTAPVDGAKYVISTKDYTVYDFNVYGQLIKASKLTGVGLRYEYDSYGRLANVISQNGLSQPEKSISMTYSETSPYTLSKIVLPDSSERLYSVSAAGQLDVVTFSHGSFAGGGTSESVVYNYGYDTNSGLLNLIKDGDLNSYSIEYESGKATKVTYPNSEYFQIGYATDGNGNTINTVAKKYGSSEFYSEQAVLDDDTGKILARTDASGISTQYEYFTENDEPCDNTLLVKQTTSQRFFETLESGTVVFSSSPVVETVTTSYDSSENVTTEQAKLTTGQLQLQSTTTSYEYGLAGVCTNSPKKVAVAVNGAPESVTDYSYNNLGQVTTETFDPFDNQGATVTQYDYIPDATLGTLEVTEEVFTAGETNASQTSTTILDTEGLAVELSSQAGTVESEATVSYDSMGRVVSETDTVSGMITTHAYDFLGREISVTTVQDGLTKTVTSSYNKNSSLVSTTDELGITTSYTFDSINRETSRTTVGGSLTGGSSTTSYGYEYNLNLPGQLDTPVAAIAYTETTTENGLPRTKWINGAGRLVKESSGGIIKYFKYDQSGNQVLEYMTDGNGNFAAASMTLYDRKGNPFATIQSPEFDMTNGVVYKVNTDPQDQLVDSILTQTLYYDNGKVKAQIDGKGIATYLSYDTMDRVTSITEDAVIDGLGNLQPGGVQSNIAYPDQYTTTCTDGAGVVSTKVVNEAGLTTLTQTGTEAPGIITTNFSYDSQGRLTKETYQDGSYRSYMYNTKGQVESFSTFTMDNQNPIEQTKVEYSYNSAGQLAGEIDSKRNDLGVMTPYHYAYFEYDDLGRMIGSTALNQEAVPTVSEKASHKTIYAYNTAGQVTQISYPQNSADEVKGLKYEYDSTRRIEYVIAIVGMTDKTLRQYIYNSFGQISAIVDNADFTSGEAEAVQRSYSYDSFGRVTSMQYMHDGVTLETFALTYDPNSNITSEVDGDITKNYSYDDLGNLTEVQTAQGQTTGTTAYTYDNAGNRLSKETATTRNEYAYNSLNQLTSMVEKNKVNGQFQQVASTSYTYDAKGNLTQDSETRGSVNTVVDNTYTVDSMLLGTTIQADSQTTLTQANTYNGSGQRIAKDENGNLTNYFYQGSNVLYTTDSADAKTSQNFLSPAGSAIATARYAPTDISYYLYNKDIRNSSVSILDETAGLATKYSYDEFGITTVDGSYTFANEICYTGGIYDWASGQYYLNARYYDPQFGRFLSEDTYRGETSDPNSWQLYAYCANNPINYTDPSGHIAIPAGAVPGAFVLIVLTLYTANITWINTPAFQAAWGNMCYGIPSMVRDGFSKISAAIPSSVVSTFSSQAKAIAKDIGASLAKVTSIPSYRRDYEVHHLVAIRAANAQYARNVLSHVGIGIDDVENLLAIKTGLHRRLHTDAYYGWANSVVIKSFREANGNHAAEKTKVLAGLNTIRNFVLKMNATSPF